MTKLFLLPLTIGVLLTLHALAQIVPKGVGPQTSTKPLVSTMPAAAQEAEQKGLLAAREQEYVLAVRYFEEARKQAPYSPDILFNLGLAESKLPGRELRAIVWFKAYLTINPKAPNVSQVNEQIAALEIKVEGNMERLLNAAQRTAEQFSEDSDRQLAIAQVVDARAETGDILGA